jgi:hypothetical protein
MTGPQDLLAPVSLAMLTQVHDLDKAERLARSRDPASMLRARRYLDQILATESGHPSPRVSYRRAIADLEQQARPGLAGFVRELARLEPVLADTTRRWQDRYSGRALTAAERDDHRAVTTADWVVWDEPYAGIDGMLYTPGLCRFWGQDVPVVLARSRSTVELIDGFTSLEAARGWVRGDRCAADPGPLVPPPGCQSPRITRDEHVLAGLLRCPGELSEVAALLPALTFTADVRYDIFTAILASRQGPPDVITRAFGGPGIDQITRETLTRLAGSPDWDNPRLGGPGTPLATAYLHRLASTPITAGTAARAAQRLIIADSCALLEAHARAPAAPQPAAKAPPQAPAAGASPATPAITQSACWILLPPIPRQPPGPVPQA